VTAATASLTASSLVGFTAPQVKQPARTVEKTAPTDEMLFDSALAGDREALGTLITRYEKGLFSLLVRMTGDTHKADDLFQETFLHAMKASATFNRTLNFKPWITAIAVNLVRDDARKRKVRGEVTLDGSRADNEDLRTPEPVSLMENPSESAERRDEELQIHRALQNLTPLEREVTLLHFFNNMTLVETSEVLGVPLGTVKSRLHAALTRLNGMLGRSKERSE
jgi:RNA polymerase sigma-70 factor, ECF subfamily